MKKCDHFKELILTDYIDGELDRNLAGSLESHLLDCNDCRVFFKEVKNHTSLPLQQALLQPVPVELWDTIRQKIEHENQALGPLKWFLEKIKGLIVFPRMVPVFASFILMFLAGSVTLNTIQIQEAKEKDQGEYLVALLSPASAVTVSDNNGGETPIEHYFL